MKKQLNALCEELGKENRTELREFSEAIKKNLKKEMRKINVSSSFINEIYEDLKRGLIEIKSDHKETAL